MRLGRFRSERNSLWPRRVQFSESSWNVCAAIYVLERQNDDGGYAFSRGTDSNAKDAYHALAILRMLNSPLPRIQHTIRWLTEFMPYGLHSRYYVAKALKLCGRDQDKKRWSHQARTREVMEFEMVDARIGSSIGFEDILMITELANMEKCRVNRQNAIGCLLNCQNLDGGFGIQRHSDLTSTHYAVASLVNLGYPANALKGVSGFVSSCETLSGGFSLVPKTAPPHMEYAYHGLMTASLLGQNPRYPDKIARFVFRCQNSNGGFARSEFGISTFEDTFYAVSILEKIGIKPRLCTISLSPAFSGGSE